MKTNNLAIATIIFGALTGNAYSFNGRMAEAVTFAPGVSVACGGARYNRIPYNETECATAVTAAPLSAVALTLVLGKRVEEVKPDALNYLAGGAPSPALYDVVDQLQDFSAKQRGREMTFEEAVDEIVKNI